MALIKINGYLEEVIIHATEVIIEVSAPSGSAEIAPKVPLHQIVQRPAMTVTKRQVVVEYW